MLTTILLLITHITAILASTYCKVHRVCDVEAGSHQYCNDFNEYANDNTDAKNNVRIGNIQYANILWYDYKIRITDGDGSMEIKFNGVTFSSEFEQWQSVMNGVENFAGTLWDLPSTYIQCNNWWGQCGVETILELHFQDYDGCLPIPTTQRPTTQRPTTRRPTTRRPTTQRPTTRPTTEHPRTYIPPSSSESNKNDYTNDTYTDGGDDNFFGNLFIGFIGSIMVALVVKLGFVLKTRYSTMNLPVSIETTNLESKSKDPEDVDHVIVMNPLESHSVVTIETE